jgi:outer membrane protein assembly factor BamB
MVTDSLKFRVKWTTKLHKGRLNIAATGGGNAYMSQGGHFTALSLADGSILWSHRLVYDNGWVPTAYAPAFHDGVASLTTSGARLWGFDAATGKHKFFSPIAAQYGTYLAPTPFADSLYVNGGEYGGAYAFNARHGDERWFTRLEQYENWTPAVDNDNAYAYTDRLHVLDRNTGVIVKTIEDAGHESWGDVNCAPVLGDLGNVLVTNAHRLVSFDVESNTINWVEPVEAGYRELNQISLHGGLIYYGKGNKVTVRSEANGHLVTTWSAPMGAIIESTVILTKNHFFVSTSRGTYAVDRKRTHTLQWSTSAHGQLALSREGILVITSVDGVVTAVDVGGGP